MRTVAALHSYTHTTGISFWDSGSLLVVSSFVTRADGFFFMAMLSADATATAAVYTCK